MSLTKDYLLSTRLSADLVNVLTPVRDNNAVGETVNPLESLTLLDLILEIFTKIAHLEVIQNSEVYTRNASEVTKTQSFSDMEVVDYCLKNTSNLDGVQFHGSHGQAANPTSPFLRFDESKQSDLGAVKNSAKMILFNLMNYLGQFPMNRLQPISLGSLVNENDEIKSMSDIVLVSPDKVELKAFNSPHVLSFIVNDSCIMSFVEIEKEQIASSSLVHKLANISLSSTSESSQVKPVRVIIRNLLGKFAWDCLVLHSPVKASSNNQRLSIPNVGKQSDESSGSYDDDEEERCYVQSLNPDSLTQVVDKVHRTIPFTTKFSDNDFMNSLNSIPEAVDMVALFTNQHFQETQFTEKRCFTSSISCTKSDISGEFGPESSSMDSEHSSSTGLDPLVVFRFCRQLIDQLGFLSTEKRVSIDLLHKSDKAIRDLRHLDNQRCRETHKIAVIYVGHGQETKEAILMNKFGSKAFEEFVSRLGWEVNLASHQGFMGGLESNLSTGLTAPYYADTFTEVMFHVSTRLEPATDDSQKCDLSPHAAAKSLPAEQLMNKKMRHLGNDEIHIVWSEHYKDYKRRILATEFGDALIVIYPLPTSSFSNLYRIQIYRKPDVVPFFGPLFNGAVVHRDDLAPLVRATAINASKAKRQLILGYKHYFEERLDSIKSLVSGSKQKCTFEEYSSRIYTPQFDLMQEGCANSQDVLSSQAEEDELRRCSLSSTATGHSVVFNPAGVMTIDKYVKQTSHCLGASTSHTAYSCSSPSDSDSLSLASTIGGVSASDSNGHAQSLQGLSTSIASSVSVSRPASRSSYSHTRV